MRNHRKINLKHTRDCVLTFAGPETLVFEKRRVKYKKFSTAFYWKCMLQMLRIVPHRRCARVRISKYDGLLLETVYESENIIKEQLVGIRFSICHEAGYQHKQLLVRGNTEIDVQISNFSSQYTRQDRVTFYDLAQAFSTADVAVTPTLGNLRILCRIANKTLAENLSVLELSKPSRTVFIQRNLRALLFSQSAGLHYYSELESKLSDSSEHNFGSRARMVEAQTRTVEPSQEYTDEALPVVERLSRISHSASARLP